MEIKSLDTPAAGTWARDCELLCLCDCKNFKIIYRRDEDDTYWQLECKGIIAYKVTNEEFRDGYLMKLPIDGAFFELLNSPWMLEFERERNRVINTCKHYIIELYDEIIEIIAKDFLFEQLKDKPMIDCKFISG